VAATLLSTHFVVPLDWRQTQVTAE